MNKEQKAGMIKRLVLFSWIALPLVAFDYVDFDTSMRTDRYTAILEQGKNKRLLTFFKRVYERCVTAGNTLTIQRIPLLMHHVWFGEPLNDFFKQLRKTWIDAHEGWTFILWTDRPTNDDQAVIARSFQELDELLASGCAQRIVVLTDQLVFDNRCYFDAARNYGERSDILKWEIVYRYGGAYIDADFECYKSLGVLHYAFDFYTGLQPLDTGQVQLGAALFAAYPQHPILERCVKDLRPGPGPIVIRTGPIHFTSACMRVIVDDRNVNIVLPAGYFYPCGYEEQELPASEWRTPDSYAVHHWSGSWLKPEAFAK